MSDCRRPFFAQALLVLVLLAVSSQAVARRGEPPYTLQQHAKLARVLPVIDLPAIDAASRRLEIDAAASLTLGTSTKRERVADPREVSLTPQRDGVWDTLADGSQLWRAQVRAAGATDLRLAFRRYALPPGATLYLIGADGYYQGPYVADDGTGETARTFRAPVVPGDTATIELHVPAAAWPLADDALELGQVGAGFRDLFAREPIDLVKLGSPGRSGACNVDVVCPLGAPYVDESRAVAHFEFFDDDERGYYICSGTLLNNTAHDRRNYFLTAAHCIDSMAEAASMVLYWNYQSTRCGALVAPAGGWFNDEQRGATLRATRADVDVTLVELDRTPQADWNVYYAGWDANGAAPGGTIGIHHPSGDAKKITAGPAPSVVGNCTVVAPAANDTHWQTGPYSQGTTEGGSSGSALFVPAGGSAQKRVIGTLTGGDASCLGSQPNFSTDCYGRLARAWNGNGAATRLRDWLDPANSNAKAIDGLDSRSTTPLAPRSHSQRPLPPRLQSRASR
ncbi:trypsin-like peptidase domain-containing protein [Dokdonella sp.]|uniref:trypsin-like serine peptidase n=1 Tax=Dokdonella sp. TaxID=2291710 RepID=UPI001B0B863C|nr:trypsin-like peptidase domain-containing protein [Dokdonella sp.]MBO9663150.1 trypsin-like peptidase domain-containing protein [Dokdonella sp.]